MKKLPYLLFGALALAGNAFGQTTATTDPVGFVTVNVNANSDSPVSLPMCRPSLLQTTVATVVGNVITLNAGLTVNQLVYSAGTQTNHYYVSVKATVAPSSAVIGKWFEVNANSTNAANASVTVDPGSATTVQAQGLVAGDSIDIIPFWTLNTLFPGGLGINATTDIDVPKDLILIQPQTVAGTNLGAAKAHLYSTDVVNLPSVGWYDASSFFSTGDEALLPDTYFVVRNKGTAKTVTVTGGVPMSAKTSNVVRLDASKKQDNFSINPFPVAISLPESNLVQSGAFQATSDIDSPKDLLLVYSGTETGFNAQPSKAYLYSTDLVNLPAAGWYDANTFAGPYLTANKLLPPGSGFIIRKAAGPITDLPWSTPKPY